VIIGMGIDMVSIAKTQKLIFKFGDRFLKKIFTEKEIEAGKKRALPAQEFAGWFAVKEAVQKALGVGIFGGIKFKDIEIISSPGTKPEIRLAGKAKKWAERLSAGAIFVSISHEDDYALASVIIDGQGG